MKTVPARPSLLVAIVREQSERATRKAKVQQRLLEMIVKNENKRRDP